MLLTLDKTLCERKQAIVVSKDNGETRMHRAINPKRQYELRHFKLDGDIVKNETCCDFLLLNDSSKTAYFIELKGGNIDDAVEQLEAGARKFAIELQGYNFLYRIICSRVSTHKVRSNKFRRFQEKCGTRLDVKTRLLEESL